MASEHPVTTTGQSLRQEYEAALSAVRGVLQGSMLSQPDAEALSAAVMVLQRCTPYVPGSADPAASEHPVTTVGRITDRYGGFLATGTSYGLVTVGGQAIPIAEARKLPALIAEACGDAEAWLAIQADNQAAHDEWLAGQLPPAAPEDGDGR